MAKTKTLLAWREVDPDTLQPDARKTYDNVLKLQTKAAAAREKFAKECAKALGLPKTKRVLVSGKFGQVSVAIDDARTKKVSRRAIDINSLKVDATGT